MKTCLKGVWFSGLDYPGIRGTARSLRTLMALTLLLVCLQSWGQSQRPKIGLVLSGGGAKGLAHIRILQVLDSLGIVPDYIAGTSMGSVIGGLYAAGYSAHSIDSIARSIDWEHMFSNSISFEEINVEEKDEFGRYIYELPMDGLKPKLPLGLVEGQHIEEMLNELFFPVNAVSDFQKLPTPFLCVASDIVKGEPVVLRSGSLAKAVRASMSIPTVFNPVRMEGKLLVDGGLYSNLPVSYCRGMGAEFIIAVDVGGGLLTEAELTSAAHFLLQASLLAGNINYQKEKEQSDIFIDVVKHLKFGTMDFEEGPSMMYGGNLAVHDALPQLVELADRLKKYPVRSIVVPGRTSSTYKLENIVLEGVSRDNARLVQNKFAWHGGEKVAAQQLRKGVHQMMGTRLFSKVGYRVEGDSIRSILVLQAEERPANAAKFAMHFDSDRGAGIILNFTKRNLFLPASRMVATIDLAENPRERLNYFYYLGKRSRLWHFTEFYHERVLMNSFINGTPLANVISNHTSISTMMNYSITPRSFLGLGISWQWNELTPKIDPRDKTNPDTLEIIQYNLRTSGIKFQFQHNSADKLFFPTTGHLTRFQAGLYINNPFSASLYQTSNTGSSEKYLDGQVRNFLQLNLRTQKNISITRTTTLQLVGQALSTIDTGHDSNQFSPYSAGAAYFGSVGGLLQRPRANNFTFMGLLESEILVPQLFTAGAQLQMGLTKNIYVIPAVNVLAAGYDLQDFWKTLGDLNFSERVKDRAFYQFGYGVTAGYMSPLGPILVTLSSDAQVGKLRSSFALGFIL